MADGSVSIDLNFPANSTKFHSDVDSVNQIVKSVGKDAGELMTEAFAKKADKVKDDAKTAAESVNTSTKNAGKDTGSGMAENFAKNADKVKQDSKSMAEQFSSTADKISHDKIEPKVDASQAKSGMNTLNRDAEETGHHFSHLKEIIAGSFIGQALSNGISQVGGAIKNAVTSGLELDATISKNDAILQSLGLRSKDVKLLDDQMEHLEGTIGFSKENTFALQKEFLGLGLSATGADKMTSAIVAIGKQSRMSNDDIVNFAGGMRRVESSGKLSSMVLARMSAQAPGLSSALAKAAGMSTKSFLAMVSSGKVTSAQFNDLMYKISGNSDKMLANYAKTTAGASDRIKGAWDALKEKMAAPLLDAKHSGLVELADMMKSKGMQDGATMLGKGISFVAQGLGKIAEYIGTHSKDISKSLEDIAQIAAIFGKAVWNTAYSMFMSIAKAFGLISDKSKGASDPLHNIREVLDKIVKNKNGIRDTAKFLLGMFAAKKALDFASALGHVKTKVDDLMSSGKDKKKAGLLSTLAGKAKSLLGKGGAAAGAGEAAAGAGEAGEAAAGAGTAAAGIGAGAATLGIGAAVVGIGVAATVAYKKYKPFHDFVNNSLKTLQKGFSGLASWLEKAFKPIEKMFAPIFKGVIKEVQKMWKDIEKGFNSVVKGIKPIMKVFVEIIKDAMQIVGVLWKRYGNIVKDYLKYVLTYIKAAMSLMLTVWKSAWHIFTTVLGAAWKLISGLVKNGLKVIRDVIKLFMDIIKGNWKDVWKDIGNLLKDAWKLIWDLVKDGAKGIWDIIKSVAKGIKNTWNSFWGGMGDIVKSAWKLIKDLASDGVNSVIDIINGAIGAINTVAKFFGGKGFSTLHHVHFAKGGTVLADDVPAIVNDDGSADPREIILRGSTGQAEMYDGANVQTHVGSKDWVFNSQQSKELAPYFGFTHFANGNVFGNAWDGVKSFFGGISDKLKDATKWLAHPIQNLAKILDKAVGGLLGKLNGSFLGQMGSGVIHMITNMASSWLKKLISGYKTHEEAVDNANNPGGAGVARWRSYIVKALKANGFEADASQVASWLKVIARESGGNPHAVQPGSDPDGDGSGPALGLAQTKRGTFDANAFPGHRNVFNGLDDLLAAIHYATGRYGRGPAMFARVALMGYQNGGEGDQEGLYPLFEGNHKEFVIPTATGAARSYEMIGRAASYVATQNGTGISGTDNHFASSMMAKMDKLLDINGGQLEELGRGLHATVSKLDVYKGYNDISKQKQLRDSYFS